MKAKRLVALLTVATMLLGTVPVSAANTATDSATVTGTGTVVDYDKTPVYEVTLPTANALDFTVDPNNLINLLTATDQSIELSTDSAVTDIWTATNSGAIIVNRSSVPITVDVDFGIVNGIAPASGGATFVATEGGLNMNTPAIWLTMQPAKANTATTAGVEFSTTAAVAILDDTAVTYSLKAADYQVANVNGTLKLVIKEEADNYEGTAFKLAGKVNRADGWERYTNGQLGITAVFSYQPDESGTPAQIVSGTYALVDAAKEQVDSIAIADFTNDIILMGIAVGQPIPGLTTSCPLVVNGQNVTFTVDEAGYAQMDLTDVVTQLNSPETFTFKLTVGNKEYVARIPE